MRFRSMLLVCAALAALVPPPAAAGHACEGVALQTIPGQQPNGFGAYPLAAGWGGCTLFVGEGHRIGFAGVGTYSFVVKRHGTDPKRYEGTNEAVCEDRIARWGDTLEVDIPSGAFFIFREQTVEGGPAIRCP